MATRLAFLLAFAGLAWLASTNEDLKRGFFHDYREPDYYNLLVDGFRDGHTAMKLDPDPRLWSEDPAIRAQAPYVLDVSYYERRYYLYNGVVPAVALILPYTLLADGDIPLNTVCAAFAFLGFCAAAATYLDARRRYFPGIGPIANLLLLLLLAFGSMSPVVVRISGHYELAVASAYFCVSAELYCLFRMLHARRAQMHWLALGSVFAGLAVGCRPNLVLALPVVPLAALAGGYLGRSWADRAWLRRAALAAIAPAAAVGIALAAYNYARFGSPSEFGFKYQVNAFNPKDMDFSSLRFAWPNLKWYYFTPPTLSAHFPYVFPINAAPFPPRYYGFEMIDGQFPVTILAGIATLGAVLWWRRRDLFAPGLRLFLGTAVVAFAISLVFMICLTFRADRYMADFQAPLVLALALTGGVLAGATPGVQRWAWSAAFGAGALAVSLHGFFGAIQHYNIFEYTRPNEFAKLSRIGNRPAERLAKAGRLQYGPIKLGIKFVSAITPEMEPIVATGSAGATDILYLSHHAGNRGQFVMMHEGTVGIRSKVVPLNPGETYQLEVDMGSLYPPVTFSDFKGWSSDRIALYKTTARVRLNGEEILRGNLKFNESSPGWVHFGENPASGGPRFGGTIVSAERLPWRTLDEISPPQESGLWRLEIPYPWLAPGEAHPLIGSGTTGRGNLLYVLSAGAPNRFRFGLDQWGAAVAFSEPFEITGEGEHRLEVFVGTQVARQKLPDAWGVDATALAKVASQMRVWWDGRLLWTTPITFHTDSYNTSSIGTNPQGFSTASALFPGQIRRIPLSPEESREFIIRNLRE